MLAMEQSARDCAVSAEVLDPPLREEDDLREDGAVAETRSFLMVTTMLAMSGSLPRRRRLSATYPTCFSEYLRDLTRESTSACPKSTS